jgi:xylan 1,4-beta-xylosidase
LDTVKKDGVRGQPDVSAIASLDGNRLAVLVWHYHDDDVPGPDADVSLTLDHLPPGNTAKLTRFVIDATHSNAYATWQKMGMPLALSDAQRADLEAAGKLEASGEPETLPIAAGRLEFKLAVPRQAVVLLVINL